jgi:hypothetical protein
VCFCSDTNVFEFNTDKSNLRPKTGRKLQFFDKNVDEREKFRRNLVKQAQKGFRPISASQIFLGSFSAILRGF